MIFVPFVSRSFFRRRCWAVLESAKSNLANYFHGLVTDCQRFMASASDLWQLCPNWIIYTASRRVNCGNLALRRWEVAFKPIILSSEESIRSPCQSVCRDTYIQLIRDNERTKRRLLTRFTRVFVFANREYLVRYLLNIDRHAKITTFKWSRCYLVVLKLHKSI